MSMNDDDDDYYYEEEIIEEEDEYIEEIIVGDETEEEYFEEEILEDDRNDVIIGEEEAVAAVVVTAQQQQQQQQDPNTDMKQESTNKYEDNGDDVGRIELSHNAPPVDYNILVVENNGVTVERRPGLGMTAIATRGYLLGRTTVGGGNELDNDREVDDNDDNDNDDATMMNDNNKKMWLTPILREQPAVLCPSNEFLEYCEIVLSLPPPIQVGVLDMFYQPLDSPMGRALEEPAKVLHYLGVLEDYTVLHQLLSLYMTNAHQYYTHTTEMMDNDDDDNDNGTSGEEQVQSAMMILGSKLTHSCLPNLGYSSLYSPSKYNAATTTTTDDDNNNDGTVTAATKVKTKNTKKKNKKKTPPEPCVSYLILRPIHKGDVLTCSYVSDLFETSTPHRRAHLSETKSFWCQCIRCMGPDYCRVLSCPNCSYLNPCQYKNNNNADTGTTSESHDSKSSSPILPATSTTMTQQQHDSYWKCTHCDVETDNDFMLSLEVGLDATYSVLERTIESNTAWTQGSKEVTPALLVEFIHECEQVLSSTHYLTLNSLRLMVNLCTSLAYLQIKRYMVRGIFDKSYYKTDTVVGHYFRKSVCAGFRLVLACECVAANCVGCGILVTGGGRSHDDNNVTDEKKQASISSPESSSSLLGDLDSYFPHPPLYDRATPMRNMCDNLLQFPVAWWPPYAVALTERYLPILRAKFGSTVATIFDTEIVQPFAATGPKVVTCYECGTTQSPTPWKMLIHDQNDKQVESKASLPSSNKSIQNNNANGQRNGKKKKKGNSNNKKKKNRR